MKNKITLGARLLLGLIYLVFGLNGFLQFLPQPPLPEQALGFLSGLGSSGYFFPVLKGTEVLGGLFLLSGILAPLALVILAPITLQILLFHVFLTPGDFAMALVMLALHLLAASKYWELYLPILQLKPAK